MTIEQFVYQQTFVLPFLAAQFLVMAVALSRPKGLKVLLCLIALTLCGICVVIKYGEFILSLVSAHPVLVIASLAAVSGLICGELKLRHFTNNWFRK